MLRKFLTVLLLLVAFSFGGENYNGWNDTAGVTDTLGAGDVFQSKAFSFSRYATGTRLLVKVNDTTSAGFSADSVNVSYGYQMGSITLNNLGEKDTTWDVLVLLDTAITSDFGVGTDTSDITGYAIQNNSFTPEWSTLIRFSAQGLAGNLTGDALEFIFDYKRRIFDPTR